MKLEHNLNTETSWEIFEDRFDRDNAVTTGSNYMIGNGYLGYRGTFADDRKDQYVACVVSDTYDNADGTWKELVTAPNGLFTELRVNGSALVWREAGWEDYRRELNVRYGEWSARARWSTPGISVAERRYAAYDDVHRLSSRMEITAHERVMLGVRTGIDGDVWSLNGNHFVSVQPAAAGEQLEVACVTGEHGYDVVVREISRLTFSDGMDVASRLTETSDRGVVRTFDVELDPGQTIVLTKHAAVYGTNDLRTAPNPYTVVAVPEHPEHPGLVGVRPAEGAPTAPSVPTAGSAVDSERPTLAAVRRAAEETLSRALDAGWDALATAHRAEWDRRWHDMDVRIGGDVTAQTVLRYNLYHNIIATPAHTDHLPIGARGLSCQAYQGAAFWDQEVFNLPMFLFSAPEIARNILVYRHKTLDGARKKARDLGYRGAYYAWISGDSGEEICPSYFFKDVVSGRRIRNHFNDWQIHISPDISYTIWKYVSVTHDWEYLYDYGAEIVFEVARFLASRSRYDVDRNEFHFIRLLGPDEYHENVDNNFFTNYQARFAVQYAVEVFEHLKNHAANRLSSLTTAIGLDVQEVDRWRELADRIYVPRPMPGEASAGNATRGSTPEPAGADVAGVIPQFDGFFRLEDTRPERLKERLLDAGEYWGWPNGVAVDTQVSKQADVTQLFMLHPTAYDRDVMKRNWEYYEPRTQHGSSLSPAVYAIVAAWVGHMEEAERYFMKSCTVDLYNDNKAVSGGTFIGGIHTAACGVSWQIVVTGFAGLYLTDGGFGFHPHLPSEWSEVAFVLKRWGARVSVTIRGVSGGSAERRTAERRSAAERHAAEAASYDVVVENAAESPRSLAITVGDRTVEVAPGGREVLPS